MTIKLTLAALMLGASTFCAVAQDFTPENPECIAPANPGGGWDFTCRQVGKSLQDQGLIERPCRSSTSPVAAAASPLPKW
jgi:putative tricarboxylic transport membrane protein